MFEQRVQGKWLKWMSLTPMELESNMPHIAAARGTVVVAGLGMGFFVYNILRKPEVTRVVVLEKDANLVTLFIKTIRRNHWRHLDKFELVLGDALQFVPKHNVDFLYADIWSHLGDETALAKTQAIQANVKAALKLLALAAGPVQVTQWYWQKLCSARSIQGCHMMPAPCQML